MTVVTMPINNKPAKNTPLQRVLGFEAAEDTYDLLDFREQLIIDLRIEGWSQHEIGAALGLSQGWVSIIFRRIRFKLADSNLRRTLDTRQFYRETHYQVMEPSYEQDDASITNY
jgi:DNA-binding NarL/FixJ family response regulator